MRGLTPVSVWNAVSISLKTARVIRKITPFSGTIATDGNQTAHNINVTSAGVVDYTKCECQPDYCKQINNNPMFCGTEGGTGTNTPLGGPIPTSNIEVRYNMAGTGGGSGYNFGYGFKLVEYY